MPASFNTFFGGATATETNPSGNTPYDYQRRLACGEPACPEPAERGRTACGDAGRPCESQLISIPTGFGKISA